MSVGVITDSNSGMKMKDGKELGIKILPMPIIINNETYFEGIDIDQNKFYEELVAGSDVFTSQPALGEVMKLWQDSLEEGYDEIVYIPMSSGLSNSCQTALMAAEEFEGKVHVVDNKRISATQKQAVLDALTLANHGFSGKEIKEKLEKDSLEASIYIAVDTMEFLKKGGRVTAAAATLGSIFNIKPILQIQGDKLDAFAKIRGMKKCRRTMIEAVQNDIKNRFNYLKENEIKILIAGTLQDEATIEEWKTQVSEGFPGYEVSYEPLSFSIACHTGPNAFGIGVCKKEI